MQPLTTATRVLAGDGGRTVSLLDNRQLVMLAWDRVQIEMRIPDLLVLDQALRAWRNGDDATAQMPLRNRFDCTEPYILSLNDRCILITEQDLVALCALVAEAVDQLPRRTVRWAELTVRVIPLAAAAAAPYAALSKQGHDLGEAGSGLACLCPN